jgi:hypothetical protein
MPGLNFLLVPMKTRIGLVSTKPFGRSTTKFVEVADVEELSAVLAKAGAKRVVRYWRDRIGDGHTEGEPFALAALNESHLKWAAAHPKDGSRGLFFDTKA